MPVPNFNIPGLGIANAALNAATSAVASAKPLALINAAKAAQPSPPQPADDFDTIMNRVRQTMASKPTGVSSQTQQEIDREDRAARELSAAKIAKSKGEIINPEVRQERAERRFIGVRQDDGRIGIQDLQGKPKILSNQEIAQNADAIGAQTRRGIQSLEATRQRWNAEDKSKFIERYGKDRYDQAIQKGSAIAREEANREKVARLRATHGGANLTPAAREIESMRQKDFEAWDRGEIGDVKTQGQFGSDPNRFRNIQISNRTASVQRQANFAAERARRQMEQNRKILNRESVDNYKEILKESVLGDLAGAAWKYLSRPGGSVPKVVDPIVDAGKWVANKFGVKTGWGTKAGKVARTAKQATRAATRVGIPAALAYGMYANSNLGQGGRGDAYDGSQTGGRLTDTRFTGGEGGGKSKRQIEVNYDVADAMAQGDKEPWLRQVASMQSSGVNASDRSSSSVRTAALAAAIARARGDTKKANELSPGTPRLQPVEVSGGEATKKYGEMLRSPGGVVGALRRQKAAEIEQKWKAEDAAK